MRWEQEMQMDSRIWRILDPSSTSFLTQRLYIETEVAYRFNPISYRVLSLFLWEIFDNILRDSWQLCVKRYFSSSLTFFFTFLFKKKKKKVKLLPLFYRRRISGLTKVNLVVVLKLKTIKPGFKSNPFCPQRQCVLPYSALCTVTFSFLHQRALSLVRWY